MLLIERLPRTPRPIAIRVSQDATAKLLAVSVLGGILAVTLGWVGLIGWLAYRELGWVFGF